MRLEPSPIISVIILGMIATYTAYILIQFYRRYPPIRDIVDAAYVMGGKPLAIVVGIA
jgi:amino acid permease